MGYDNSVIWRSAESQLNATRVTTIMQWAQDGGKDTGFVTTARATHATPGALYAHVASRDWECDREMPSDCPEEAKDIAYQLVMNDPGRRAKVVMGGGLPAFIPEEDYEASWKPKPLFNYEKSNRTWDCSRLDGLNLVDEFLRKNKTVPGFENLKGNH